ncbi:hypothetical protein BSKO_05574 [Bryopsis sp. KO-2023]|nr:hypothetical protein BSKO_05574 [Bryopsis sp. KO-2023]
MENDDGSRIAVISREASDAFLFPGHSFGVGGSLWNTDKGTGDGETIHAEGRQTERQRLQSLLRMERFSGGTSGFSSEVGDGARKAEPLSTEEKLDQKERILLDTQDTLRKMADSNHASQTRVSELLSEVYDLRGEVLILRAELDLKKRQVSMKKLEMDHKLEYMNTKTAELKAGAEHKDRIIDTVRKLYFKEDLEIDPLLEACKSGDTLTAEVRTPSAFKAM